MLLNRTPIKIGTPHQRSYDTKEEALNRINQHNGVTDVYVQLYPTDVIDKVYWDFDYNPDDPEQYSDHSVMLNDYRALTYHLKDQGWQQMSVLSGGGLHKYIKTTEVTLENPGAAIKNVQEKFQEEVAISSDPNVFGNTAQIMRVPNTWHPGRGRYCIPLTYDEIMENSWDELVELAQEQRFDVNPIVPGDEYPIAKHDKATNFMSPLQSGGKIEGNFNPAELEPENVKFPIYPCISNLLKNQDEMESKGHGLGFRRRFLVILHLKETGHSYQEAIQILKKYLTPEEYRHCVREEEQVKQIYQRDDLLFPSCDNLMQEIPCIHEEHDPCESKDELYI